MGIRRFVKPGSNTRVLFTKNYVKKSTVSGLFYNYVLLFTCYIYLCSNCKAFVYTVTGFNVAGYRK